MKALDAIQKVEAKLDFLLSSKDLDTKTAAHLELKLELLLRLDEAVDQFILVDHRKKTPATQMALRKREAGEDLGGSEICSPQIGGNHPIFGRQIAEPRWIGVWRLDSLIKIHYK